MAWTVQGFDPYLLCRSVCRPAWPCTLSIHSSLCLPEPTTPHISGQEKGKGEVAMTGTLNVAFPLRKHPLSSMNVMQKMPVPPTWCFFLKGIAHKLLMQSPQWEKITLFSFQQKKGSSALVSLQNAAPWRGKGAWSFFNGCLYCPIFCLRGEERSFDGGWRCWPSIFKGIMCTRALWSFVFTHVFQDKKKECSLTLISHLRSSF